jgi:serine/threonine protein phosphatase PrpC
LGGEVTTTTDKNGKQTFRVKGSLAVSRALGDFFLNPFVTGEPQIHGPIQITPDKKTYFLIMACDGLWDKVSDEEAVR